MQANETFQGPAWDNSDEYSSFEDSAITEDLSQIKAHLEAIDQDSKALGKELEGLDHGKIIKASKRSIEIAVSIAKRKVEVRALLANLSVFANCQLSVDGSHEAAKKLQGNVQELFAKAQASFQTQESWLINISTEDIEQYFSDELASTERFFFHRRRSQRAFQLSLAEEKLLKNLEVHGPTAFGNLYTNLSSSISVTFKDQDAGTQHLGLANATALLESADADTRHRAYRGIEQAWQQHGEASAASLNALTGWRLSVYEKRNYPDFLHEPLFNAAIERSTLESMMAAIKSAQPQAQQVLQAQRRMLKLDRLGPWDLFAPFPDQEPQHQEADSRLSFAEAIHLIKEAFSSIHPEMSDFVQLMTDKRWIEGSLGDRKRPGAYCTKFLKSRNPRVYMSYSGGMKDVITLAHELGHAFHNWVMRDLPITQSSYPMTLAETASILSQTVVTRHLTEQAGNDQDRLRILWTEAREAEAFLLNIPVRFDFEVAINQLRAQESLTPAKLCRLMEESWQNWYGSELCEGNRWFWASKLHFHISSLSFYNFPYSFGYLFSLGVLAQKEKLGSDFYPQYIELLRDTGRMTAEELATKHLQSDLRQQHFWQDSLSVVKQTIKNFVAKTN